MKRPVILIFASRKDDTTFCCIRYSDAITSAGGIPLIVPMKTDEESLKQLCDLADGFLFAGGVDLDPSLYGEKKLNDTVEIDAMRDALEMSAVKLAFETGKPILGICRGIQSVNVGLGGSLWQDIPAQIEGALCHQQKAPGTETTHTVNIKPGTKLYKIIGAETVKTNTFHHQAVKAPGKGLIVSAQAEDGVTEALETEDDRYLLLIQWHPEFTAVTDKVSAALFNSFIEEAKRVRV
ncbi:MAG: gamma-glutamyl-gamma-aminobutyrate hydrolase family protein [Clostridia bacterium]|nr:gamma-glutamyl-gamma-aminobutyrate hydrolase family protein [Clostridia bacterium]